MPNAQPTAPRTLPHVRAMQPNGHVTYVPLWAPPHPNGRRGSYTVPTMGAHHVRNHPARRHG